MTSLVGCHARALWPNGAYYGTLIGNPTPGIQWYNFRPLGVTPNQGMGPREALFVKLLWPLVIRACRGYKSVKFFAEPVHQLFQSSSVFPAGLAFTNQRRVCTEYYTFLYTAVDLWWYFGVLKLEVKTNNIQHQIFLTSQVITLKTLSVICWYQPYTGWHIINLKGRYKAGTCYILN